MEVYVTKHAIQRYRQRLFDFTSSSSSIETILKEIAQKGKATKFRISSWDNCLEVKYKGISIVTVNDLRRIVVVTCLGDICYRKWIKCQDHYIRGRVLHPLLKTGA